MIHEIRGAWRDLNCKGKGPETFRKAWRGGRWQWVSGYLSKGTFLAGDRKDATRGPVETGEIIAEFSRVLPDKRCSLDKFWEVQDEEKPLRKLAYSRKTLTTYEIVRINGEKIEVPDPMARD